MCSEAQGLKRGHDSSYDSPPPAFPSSLVSSTSGVAVCGSTSNRVVAGPGILGDQALAESRRKKVREEEDHLKNTLRELKLYCSLHWACWGIRQDHPASSCTLTDMGNFFQWKKTVRLPGHHQLCFICWAPMEKFNHRVNGIQECEVGDVLPQVAYAAWMEPTFRRQLEGIGLTRDATEEMYRDWLVRKQDAEFNFMVVFCAI